MAHKLVFVDVTVIPEPQSLIYFTILLICVYSEVLEKTFVLDTYIPHL